MREELVLELPRGETRPPARPVTVTRRRTDRYELALLGVFGLLSLWVLGLDVWQVVAHGRVWTGTDGVYIVDQMQYLAWIREASSHVLAANLFVLRPTTADYFQPAVVISGGLTALGLPMTLSLLVWKPVAVAATFAAFRAYVHRSFATVWARRAGLTLALFFGSVTVAYGSFTVLGDLYPVFLSWGYTFGLMALAAMAAAIVLYDRDRARDRVSPWPAVLGALAAVLHPWHGELLAVTLIVAELLMWRRGRPVRLAHPAAALAGIAVALIYYAILGKADLSWHLARDASKHSFSLWPIALYLTPLLIPALLALRRPARTFLATATRSWVLASLIIFVLSATALGATPLHAFEGITLPLGLLAVEGVRTLRLRRLPRPRLVLVAVLAVATVPGTLLQLKSAKELAAPTWDNANFIEPSENAALNYIARQPGPGGVLTRSYLGAMVPQRTGRHTLIGDCLWSEPRCTDRTDLAQNLFSNLMDAGTARRFVDRTHARFALADCKAQANLRQLLGPLIVGVRRFGCATVYELRASGRSHGALANLRHDAAVRAPRRQ